MADNQVIHALEDKAPAVRQAIVTYEEGLERTRHELVVTATLTIFERDGGRITDSRPAHVCNLFKRGEVLSICKAALSAQPGGMTTRELAVACLAAREFDHDDPVLVRAMVGGAEQHAQEGGAAEGAGAGRGSGSPKGGVETALIAKTHIGRAI